MHKHPIFIVDDHADTTQILELILATHGYLAKSYVDTTAALKDLHACEQPCIIFLDHSLPEIQPLEFIKQARRINPPHHFVLMTGLDAKHKAAELGLRYFLQKPFEPDSAVAIVERLYPQCASV
jgi:DNA-binding NtrC family response regulator